MTVHQPTAEPASTLTAQEAHIARLAATQSRADPYPLQIRAVLHARGALAKSLVIRPA